MVDYSDLAMVSRIRVEVRGGSMEAAERVAFMVVDHARMAGYLEGVVPESGSWTDHFFNRPTVVGKPGDGPEVWSELGMGYAGRLAFTFEPMVAMGGLKQYGYKPVEPEDGGGPPPQSEHGHLVLSRQRPVTREHSWDGLPPWEPPLGSENGEAVLADIRTIRDVISVDARIEAAGAAVVVQMDGRENVVHTCDSLHEAAIAARQGVIQTLRQGEGTTEP